MSPVFFTDRDLGKKFPQILRQAGLTVERHADHFAADTPDEQWLEVIGHRRWINAQPFYGFEGEHTTRSPKFLIAEGTLCMQSAQTKRLFRFIRFTTTSWHTRMRYLFQ